MPNSDESDQVIGTSEKAKEPLGQKEQGAKSRLLL